MDACTGADAPDSGGPAVLLADINSDAGAPSFPSFLTAVDDVLYFTAFPAWNGTFGELWYGELWRSDGTPEGTWRVRGFEDYPHDLTEVDGRLFFTAGDGDSWGIWVSDGSEETTTLVRALAPNDGTTRAQTCVANGRYFVAAYGVSGTAAGFWMSDGTEGGTEEIGVDFEPRSPVALGGEVLFFSPRGPLWKTNGTSAGTGEVRWLDPEWYSPVAVSEGVLYFTGGYPEELWRTDGTPSGTFRIFDLEAGHFSAAEAVPGGLAFVSSVPHVDEAGEPVTSYGLWRSDGITVGAEGIAVLDGSASASWGIAALDTTLLIAGGGLWRSDSDGTVLVCATGGDLFGPVAVGTVAVMRQPTADGADLLVTDGTPAGTSRIQHFHRESDMDLAPSAFTLAGDYVFFTAGHEGTGEELWAVSVSALEPR